MNEMKWIPVAERLPDDGTPVLVVNDDGEMIVARYKDDDWYYKYCNYDYDVWDYGENGIPTHWMPLPPPPDKPETTYNPPINWCGEEPIGEET